MKSNTYFLNKFVLLVILSFSLSRFCFAQWQWVWPDPQGNNLNSVSFFNNSTGIFVGEGGIILKTTNSGINYDNINIGSSYHLRACIFVDENLCFAGGTSSKIFKSTNSGANWISSDIHSNSGITGITFINKTTGWISALSNKLYRTTNSGDNWVYSEVPYISSANSIFFLNERIGFIAGNGDRVKIIKTTNAGADWERVDYTFSGSINSICFVDSLVGFTCANEGKIAKTTNGGISWTLQNTEVTIGTFTSIKIDGSMVYSTYQNNNGLCAILKSTNNGNNWQAVYHDTLNYLTSLELNDQNIFVTGSIGRIIKSTNNGNDWISNKGNVLNGFGYIKFLNEMTGIASSSGLTYRTTNGGINWNIYGRDTNVNSIFSTDFVDLNTGYKVGGNSNLYSRIYKTTNGGIKWTQLSIQTSRTIACVDFINGSTGIICGMGGLIAKTTNGAVTWQVANTGSPHWHDVICFIDNNNCISGNSNGDVYKSTDGGINWFISATNIGVSINSISFSDNLTGYIGANGLFKTTNGGYNWIDISGGGVFHDLKFYNSNTGFVSGYNGKIYRTTNGGLNWINESYLPANLNFHSYCFIDSEIIYMLGSNFLFKTTNGGVLTNHLQNVTHVPSSYGLLQNYPNPFNPTTTISFSLSNDSFVKLRVFDITGKEVNILINDYRQTGIYKLTFDGTNLPSGIYFYGFETENFNQLRKMILIK